MVESGRSCHVFGVTSLELVLPVEEGDPIDLAGKLVHILPEFPGSGVFKHSYGPFCHIALVHVRWHELVCAVVGQNSTLKCSTDLIV